MDWASELLYSDLCHSFVNCHMSYVICEQTQEYFFVFSLSFLGYYIYIEASDLFNGQVVRLESKEFFTPICLHFHYHMYGKDIGELRLEQRNLKDNSTMVLWSRKGPQDDSWHSGLQDFYGDHYTVSYEKDT